MPHDTNTDSREVTGFPYAEASDADLDRLLTQAIADQLPFAQMVEESRKLRETYASLDQDGKREADQRFGFGVQFWADGRDYPDWEDRDDWETTNRRDLPLRFTTEDAARLWGQATAEKEFRARHRRWRSRHKKCQRHKELYDRRVQALKDAGLWIQDWEAGRISPLLVPAGAGWEPRRDDQHATRYRVVADSDMDDPVMEWWLES